MAPIRFGRLMLPVAAPGWWRLFLWAALRVHWEAMAWITSRHLTRHPRTPGFRRLASGAAYRIRSVAGGKRANQPLKG